MATHYMNRQFGQPATSTEQKSKTVAAAEDAAMVSTHFKTCVDNFGSRVLAVWLCKDSCAEFVKFLTPAERKELRQMEIDDEEECAC